MAIIERLTQPLREKVPSIETKEPIKKPVQMAPVTPEEIHQGERQIDLSRRGILKGIGLGVGGALVGGKTLLDIAEFIMDTDKNLTERDAIRREGSVRFDDRSTKDHFPFTTTLIFPGFNVDEVDVTGQVLARDISHYGQVATVDYGNNRFDPNEIADKTINFCQRNNIYMVNLLGVSMGGMVALDIAPKLREAKIGIESGLFVSSPAAQEDVIGSEANDVTAIRIYNTMVDLGLASHGGAATRRFAEGHVNQVLQERRPEKYNIITESENELPNNIILEQIEFIGTFSVTDAIKRAMKNIPTGYIRAPQGIADNTIDVLTAPFRLATQLTGDHHSIYEHDGITHANVWQHPNIFGSLALRMREDHDLPLWPAA